MRNFWNKCVCIVILQFVLVAAALANTLTLSEDGEVFAETDRYRVRFKDGVLIHFHNKLTNETYTLPPEGPSNGWSGLSIQHEEGEDDHSELIDDTWEVEIRRLAPLSVEIAYHSDYSDYRPDYRFDKTVRIRISIDAHTRDLVIQQHGISKHIISIMWGCGYLNTQQVDVILPAGGGEIIDADSEISKRGFRHFEYPGRWEAQLAILQGGDGGLFVRSTDTTFRFKAAYYARSAEHFGMSFKTHNPAPFRDKHEITSVEWRLNTYRGDWHVPALDYRKWMETAFQPKQPPAWVKDLEVVIYAPYQPLDISILPLLAEHVNPSTTLLYIIGWYDPSRGLEPEYPPDPEFGDFLKAAHAYGFRVMPRITFHGCSPYSPLYPEFEKYQFRHPTRGHKLGYELNNPTYDYPTAYINPASKAFRKYVVDQMKTLYETYPIDALHLDINTSVVNDANGLIDGLTAAEGNVLLHQEFAEAMPGIVLGGEGVHEVTFFNTNLAQQPRKSFNEQPHPISSFLFSPWTLPYGFHVPNPDREPEFYQPFQEAYVVWNVLPTIRIRAHRELTDPNMVRTRSFLKSVRMGQTWEQTWNIIDIGMDRIGDTNEDRIMNVINLVFVGYGFSTDADLGEPIDEKAQVYKTPKGVSIEGLFIREFTNGWAVYNRSGKERKIYLPEKVSAVASGVVSKHWHTIPDLDGEIFLKQTTPTPEPDIGTQNRYDVDRDGDVDVSDVRLVVLALGQKEENIANPRTDVNKNNKVDKNDVLLVIENLDEANGAPLNTDLFPPLSEETKQLLNPTILRSTLEVLSLENDRSLKYQQAIAYLEYLLAAIRPDATQLLANYPNPFNPETWIPYQLANPSDVQITIYDTRGTVVRHLDLGHQQEGYYTSRSRAAYWDGRNDVGERVASGVYFYQLQADNLSLLRKMVILK